MPLDPRLERLRARAARALGDRRIRETVTRVRAIIGPHSIPDSEAGAQAALDRLRNGEAPSAHELAALETVIRLMRPVVYCRNGRLDDLPHDPNHDLHAQEYRDLWSTFRRTVRPLLFSIGRIELVDGARHIGTGFLVADGVLATNRHVLAALTSGCEVLAPGTARVVFKQEVGLANSARHVTPLESVAAIHPKLDMVLLRIRKLGRPVVDVAPEVAVEGARVAVIGFPADDAVNNPLFLSGVFQGTFGVKRAALGEVLDGTETPLLFHDCSTTQGNSGSPVFSLDSGQVVGIHRAGFFMYRNEAVDALELRSFIAANTP